MQPSPSSQDRFRFLDVARGGAAVLVLLEHGLQACFPSYRAFALSTVVTGQAAILVFFMISGFVIPMSLEKGGSLRQFWWRRCFRLLPVYWFSILLGLAYLCTDPPAPLAVQLADVKSWLANVFLMQGWLQRPNVWGVYWSLHFEVAFYVLCSIGLAVGLLRRTGPKMIAALLIAFCLACIVKALRTNNPTDDMYNWMILLSALFGTATYRYSTAVMTSRQYYGVLSLLVGVLAAVWILNHALFPHVATYGQLFRTLWTGGLGFFTFVYLFETRDGSLPRLFDWLGRRSYPIYLLHPFVLIILTIMECPAWCFIPILIGATLLFAEVVHRRIENPAIELGRRWEKALFSKRSTPVASVRRAA